tara:strand:- start:33 stop:260 length:228 start_codon:yes stop_codon:yes gene_type:complete
MNKTKKLENIKRLNNYLSQRADILNGIYLLNENILKQKLLNGERIILGVKVDNSFRIIEDTLNPFKFAYEFIGIS